MLRLHNLFLRINPIDKNVKLKIAILNNNAYLATVNNKRYYVTTTELRYHVKKLLHIDIFNNNKHNLYPIADTTHIHRLLQKHLCYGGVDSFIVDMQGINSFLYAKSMVFHDYVVRAILISLHYLTPSIKYLRLGASGSRSKDYHPGGEVLEYSLINGTDGSGISQTQSGYLPKKSLFSKKTLLNELDNRTLRDERTIYSHSVWLTPATQFPNNNLCFGIEAIKDNIDILELIDSLVKTQGIEAYSIQIVVAPEKNSKTLPVIVGRVLKHLPHSPIKTVQEAGDIASEQTFKLYPNQSAVFFGTNYHRIQKDWEDFRGGKPYEAKGHIHGAIITNNTRDDQHSLFHLRNMYLSPDTKCHIIITPIKRIVAIEPVIVRNYQIISKANRKIITSMHS